MFLPHDHAAAISDTISFYRVDTLVSKFLDYSVLSTSQNHPRTKCGLEKWKINPTAFSRTAKIVISCTCVQTLAYPTDLIYTVMFIRSLLTTGQALRTDDEVCPALALGGIPGAIGIDVITRRVVRGDTHPADFFGRNY